MIEDTDVAVVGAGPAGLSAAGEAAQHGARVILLDDNGEPGGQYFRHPPATWLWGGTSRSRSGRTRLDALLAALRAGGVDYRARATVWDFPEPSTLAIADGTRSGRIRARAIVLATGARDRAVPFPGWTLPGVVSAGGVQNLIKGMRVAPPGPALVAGNGPLLLVAAASLVRAGVRVAAVVEAADVPRRALREAGRLALAPAIAGQAAGYRVALLAAGVRMLYGHCVVAAHGSTELESVEIAPVDAGGRPARAARERIAVRTLVTGFGLAPSLELARLAGAREAREPLLGGSVLARDASLMTSVPGIFAAGDGAAIGGVAVALLEGRLAGLEAARLAGTGAARKAPADLRMRLARARLDRVRAGIARVFAPPATWRELITGETILCRCEDVRMADIEARIGEGARSATQLKHVTRFGMGRCQGRNCLAALGELLAARGLDPALPRVRPPARPILLGDLMTEDIPPPELPADPHLPRAR